VLAITFGYFLISTIPRQLAPLTFDDVPPLVESEKSTIQDESMLGNKAPSGGRYEEDALESSNDATDGIITENGQLLYGYSNIFSTLVLNFLIALGVYIIARRRLV